MMPPSTSREVGSLRSSGSRFALGLLLGVLATVPFSAGTTLAGEPIPTTTSTTTTTLAPQSVYQLSLWSPFPLISYDISQEFREPGSDLVRTDTCTVKTLSEGETYEQFRAILDCRWTEEAGGPAMPEDWNLVLTSARNAFGLEVPSAHLCPVCFGVGEDCDLSYICGDTTEDGKLSAADALATLIAAVSCSETTPEACCEPTLCDVDIARGGASDALAVLRAAVGLPQALMCPSPCDQGPSTQ